jgi:hypothetical protein
MALRHFADINDVQSLYVVSVLPAEVMCWIFEKLEASTTSRVGF